MLVGLGWHRCCCSCSGYRHLIARWCCCRCCCCCPYCCSCQVADKDHGFNPSAQLALVREERFAKNSNYLPIDYFEPSKLLEACAAKEGTKAGLPSSERASPGV